jgi:hypothetical protein
MFLSADVCLRAVRSFGRPVASKRTPIAHEMQMIDYIEGGYIILFFPAVIDGYAPKVNGIVQSKTGAHSTTGTSSTSGCRDVEGVAVVEG